MRRLAPSRCRRVGQADDTRACQFSVGLSASGPRLFAGRRSVIERRLRLRCISRRRTSLLIAAWLPLSRPQSRLWLAMSLHSLKRMSAAIYEFEPLKKKPRAEQPREIV